MQSFEASKRSSLNSRFEKFEEALKKKEEEEMMKSQKQREKLDKKLEEHNEKREAYLNDIKSKLKDHVSRWILVGLRSNFTRPFDHLLASLRYSAI